MGKYTIQLSDGTTTVDIYDLEKNGGLSTERQILSLTSTSLKLHSDLTYRFVNGFQFDIVGGTPNDGTYTVSSSTYNSIYQETTINVNTNIPNTTALPLGKVVYSLPNSEIFSPLVLPGKGTTNFGEEFIKNFIHILENFASNTAPTNPLIGQMWLDKNSNSFNFWDGTTWQSISNVGSGGSQNFVDPQHPTDQTNPTFALSANDNDVGISIKALIDPNSGDSIFRVLSNNNDERLRVEHDGKIVSQNVLDIQGTGDNLFADNINFSNDKGIKSSTGATIKLDATGNTWIIKNITVGASPLEIQDNSGNTLFKVRGDNVVESISDFAVDTNVLYVDTTNNKVGIGTTTPSTELDVVGNATISNQILASNGSQSLPSYTFNSANNVGMKLSGTTDVEFVSNNKSLLKIKGSGVLSVDPNGTIATGYESIITNDDDVPNKKYVDDLVAASGINKAKLYYFGFGN